MMHVATYYVHILTAIHVITYIYICYICCSIYIYILCIFSTYVVLYMCHVYFTYILLHICYVYCLYMLLHMYYANSLYILQWSDIKFQYYVATLIYIHPSVSSLPIYTHTHICKTHTHRHVHHRSMHTQTPISVLSIGTTYNIYFIECITYRKTKLNFVCLSLSFIETFLQLFLFVGKCTL